MLITGGSSGIGLELARQLACAGAKITLVARGVPALEAATAELLSCVGSAGCVGYQAADVTIPAQVCATLTLPFVQAAAITSF